MRVERLSPAEWEQHLPSDGFDVFHRREALDVLDEHAPGTLRRYAGFKGDSPVALLPLFVREGPLGTALLSPPPSYGVSRLGPLLMPTSPKRRKHEKINSNFAEGVLDDLAVEEPLTLFRMVCHTEYPDPRPFGWADFSIEPSFTYRLDLADADLDDVLASFSKSLRREITDGEELNVTVETDRSALVDIYETTRQRYEEGGRAFTLEWPYVRDLVDALGPWARVYVVRNEAGAVLTGIVVLYSNDAAYFWLGGARTTHEGVSINSLLHWRIIEDVVEDPPTDSIDTYDLVGANTERLCRYKSKFGADLVPYYTVESSGATMDVAKRVYESITRGGVS